MQTHAPHLNILDPNFALAGDFMVILPVKDTGKFTLEVDSNAARALTPEPFCNYSFKMNRIGTEISFFSAYEGGI